MSTIERELVALGSALDAPAGVGLARRVQTRISVPEERRGARRWLIALVALAVSAGAAYSTVPAVAEWLGIGGVEVRLDSPATRPRTDRLQLGRRVTLPAARAFAGFEVRIPRALGEPDEVWVDESTGVRTVWLAYAGPGTAYRALLMQSDARLAENPLATKFAEPGTTVESVTVGAAPGLWIGGAHTVVFYDRRGGVVVDRLRLSDSALLWERDGVTLRLESSLDRDASVRVAESVD